MFFQHPSLLWGLLTVAVPIALHFWHQQQAKPMPWAMLRWLETPNQPPKRGLKFDNWLLLLLRCLLLVALALLLARPSFTGSGNTPAGRRIHLVEPSAAVTDAYRFELEQALTRQERLFWATTPLTPLTTLADRPNTPAPNPLQWQTALATLTEPAVQLHAYLTNRSAWLDAPRLAVPAGFVLHATDPPARVVPARYLTLSDGRQLTVGNDRRLTVAPAGTALGQAVGTAPLRVLVHFRQPAERQVVQAALGAITAVYGLRFMTDNQPIPGATYNWVLTDQTLTNFRPNTLYTLTGQLGDLEWPNVRYITDPLTPQTSEWVATGQLPERLADQLATYLGLAGEPASLPRSQLASLFVPVVQDGDAPSTAPTRNWFQTGLLLVFLSLLLAERYVAIRRQT